jgi:hypothetical protein
VKLAGVWAAIPAGEKAENGEELTPDLLAVVVATEEGRGELATGDRGSWLAALGAVLGEWRGS